MTRVALTTRTREAVIRRDGIDCYICGRLCVRHRGHDQGQQRPANELTIDPVTPRAKGGKNDIANLRVCCRECNESKDTIRPIGRQQEANLLRYLRLLCLCVPIRRAVGL